MLPAVDDDGVDLTRGKLANDRCHLDAFGARSYNQQDTTLLRPGARSSRVQRRIHTCNGMRQTVRPALGRMGRPGPHIAATDGFLLPRPFGYRRGGCRAAREG